MRYFLTNKDKREFIQLLTGKAGWDSNRFLSGLLYIPIITLLSYGIKANDLNKFLQIHATENKKNMLNHIMISNLFLELTFFYIWLIKLPLFSRKIGNVHWKNWIF